MIKHETYLRLRRILILLYTALFTLTLIGCGVGRPAPTRDPHEGMVEVPNGAGGNMWVPLLTGVPISDFERTSFRREGDLISFTDENYIVQRGIDVSHFQEDIDWETVRAGGIEFAMIRCGYRGYSVGVINEDPKFHENAAAALDAGLEIGIYFFSQAVTVSEARKEADFVLKMIRDYNVTLPVAFDWERIGAGETARTDDIGGAQLTDFALAFCSEVRRAGYTPAVYFYRSLGYLEYELERMGDLTFWVGAAGEYPDFYYEHEIWQYSFTGRVAGINTDVDLNLRFLERNTPAE